MASSGHTAGGMSSSTIDLSGTRMFRALFQYLPLRDSPNDQPQLELSLNPGDLIVVRGEMDEDGFYRGETMDGQCGLVPSNYVERVSDAWLSSALPSTSTGDGINRSAHSALQRGESMSNQPTQPRSISPSFQLNVPAHLAAIQHDFTSEHLLGGGYMGPPPLPDSVCPYPPADVSRVTVTEIKETDTPRVPWPRDLVIEKRLSRSVVISWSPPEESYQAVSQYHVCIDGTVRAVVPGNYKNDQCRALVEDISLESSCNISIRAVTEHGHSPDAACTMAVGLEATIAPQHLRVFNVTPVSVCIRWHPSNSNSDHVVSLNAVKVGVCPPSVYQVQVHGLTPSTIYRISVRTKHPKAVLEQRPVERCIDFKTLPKIGLPDPPSSVQVESGPQPGTLLVSWLPVTNQPKSPSRAAIHSYLVYADGRNIAQVPLATADHVLLRLADLSDDPPIFITVRARTREGAVSSDSNVARVPRGLAATGGIPYPSVGGSGLIGIGTGSGSGQLGLQGTGALIGTGSALSPLATAHLGHSLTGQNIQPGLPLNQPLQAVTNFSGVLPGPLSDPLTGQIKEAPMASSYPSAIYHSNAYATGPTTATYGTLPTAGHYRTVAGPSPLLLSSGVTTTVQQQQQQVAPYSAPVLPPSSHPSYTTPSGLVQPYGTNTYTDMMGSMPAMQTTLQQQWKQTTTPVANTGQYYTFHPRLLRADASGRTVEERPSVLEMENNYVLRHRQAEWGARVDAYARQNRALSTDAVSAGGTLLRQTTQSRLIPPRLARVKSESGFGTRSEPDLRPPIMDEDCRWFVALFDYSHHMSPNPNAEQEELSFRKHQLIKVFGDVDTDGFFQGQIGNRVGLVPSNMIIEIAKDDLMPRRQPVAGAMIGPAEAPSLRRARWGSLKSRSYDHAGDRRHYHRGREADYASLDRREPRGEPREHRYRRANGSRDYEERRGTDPYHDRERDRDYRSTRGDPRDVREPRDPYSRNPEYPPEDDYRRGGSDYEQRGERRHHHDYRGEEYDRRYDRGERERERERDYHDRSRYDSGPGPSTSTGGPQGVSGGQSSSVGERGGPSSGVNHIIQPSSMMAASDHLVQPGGHYTSQPGPSGIGQHTQQQLQHQQSQPSQSTPYTGNGHVMTGAGGTTGMAQLQQGMAGMSLAGQQQPQMTSQQQMHQQYASSAPGYGSGGSAGQMMGQTPAQMGQPGMGGAMMHDGMNGGMTKRMMVAKFDYDSRQLSPNVDAEQVELSFRQGDAITIYGEMDEDGFYMGELNGQRGLVPSNFLTSSPMTRLIPSQPTEPMMMGSKSVGFSESAANAMKKAAPARQTSQTSTGAAAKPTTKKSSVAQPGAAKSLSKKTSDVSKGAPNARKTSTAVKKAEPTKKK